MRKLNAVVAGIALWAFASSNIANAKMQSVASKEKDAKWQLPAPHGTFSAAFPLRLQSVGKKTILTSGDGTTLTINKKIKNFAVISGGNIRVRSEGITFELDSRGTTLITGKGLAKVQWNIDK